MHSLVTLGPCNLGTHCPKDLPFCPDHERCDDGRAQTKEPDQREAPKREGHAAYGGPCHSPELVTGGQHSIGRGAGLAREFCRQYPSNRLKDGEQNRAGTGHEHGEPQGCPDYKSHSNQHASTKQSEGDPYDAPCPPRHNTAEQTPKHRPQQREGEREGGVSRLQPIGADEQSRQIGKKPNCCRLIERIGAQDMPDPWAVANGGEPCPEGHWLPRRAYLARPPDP